MRRSGRALGAAGAVRPPRVRRVLRAGRRPGPEARGGGDAAPGLRGGVGDGAQERGGVLPPPRRDETGRRRRQEATRAFAFDEPVRRDAGGGVGGWSARAFRRRRGGFETSRNVLLGLGWGRRGGRDAARPVARALAGRRRAGPGVRRRVRRGEPRASSSEAAAGAGTIVAPASGFRGGGVLPPRPERARVRVRARDGDGGGVRRLRGLHRRRRAPKDGGDRPRRRRRRTDERGRLWWLPGRRAPWPPGPVRRLGRGRAPRLLRRRPLERAGGGRRRRRARRCRPDF